MILFPWENTEGKYKTSMKINKFSLNRIIWNINKSWPIFFKISSTTKLHIETQFTPENAKADTMWIIFLRIVFILKFFEFMFYNFRNTWSILIYFQYFSKSLKSKILQHRRQHHFHLLKTTAHISILTKMSLLYLVGEKGHDFFWNYNKK